MTQATRLMIGVPEKPAWVAGEHERSKLVTQRLFFERGLHLRCIAIPDCAWIGHARAAIVAKFMASDCTHLLMIDNDVSWQPEDIFRVLGHDVPFVGAVQPARKREGKFQLGTRSREPGAGRFKYDPATQLLTAERISAAFNLIRRDCIERLMEAHPHLQARRAADWYMKGDEAAKPYFYGFWEQRIVDGDWPGEDHAFCDRLVDAGIPVMVDPWIKLGHWVEVCRYGSLGEYHGLPVPGIEASGEAA